MAKRGGKPAKGAPFEGREDAGVEWVIEVGQVAGWQDPGQRINPGGVRGGADVSHALTAEERRSYASSSRCGLTFE